tara:strand:+ start:1808 stop:2713 length:906 start_codon:yes stop_codon:yes gene_type:complete
MKNTYRQKIESLLSNIEFISFDYEDNTFLLDERCNTVDGFKNVTKLLEKLRWDDDFWFDVKQTPIGDMNFSYHDSCMQNYCYQIIDQGISHKDTCWENVTSRRFHMGIFNNNQSFDRKFKEKFINDLSINTNNIIVNNVHYSIKRDFKKNKEKLFENLILSNDNWMNIQLINPISFSDRKERLIHELKKRIKNLTGYKLNERIIEISENILNKKWNHDLGWECPNTVLGYSIKSNEYMTFTGRHRVNAAVYLYNKGIDIGINHFNYPVLKYNWSEWLHAVFPTKKQLSNVRHCCRSCRTFK